MSINHFTRWEMASSYVWTHDIISQSAARSFTGHCVLKAHSADFTYTYFELPLHEQLCTYQKYVSGNSVKSSNFGIITTDKFSLKFYFKSESLVTFSKHQCSALLQSLGKWTCIKTSPDKKGYNAHLFYHFLL